MPTISVVIATYNRAALLRATLDRLREQDYLPGDEVIVVDNGSTDATGAVIAQAAATFPVPLIGLVERAPGKSRALNAALPIAHGAILALTDDDVLVAPDWIATIRTIFSESPVALVGGRVDPNWERPAPSWLRFEENGQYGPMSSPLALLHYGETQELGSRTAVGANMAIRASVLASLGGFAPDLGRRRGTLLCGEDHDLCQRAVASGLRCEYRPEMRVRHWVPAERASFRYYWRWFFWSGITQAQMSERLDVRHFWGRLLRSPMTALGCLVAGRRTDAASRAFDVAFAAGYLAARIRIARMLRDTRPDTTAAPGAMPDSGRVATSLLKDPGR
jgi:GT2 family glycosyltransferase